MDDDLKFLLKLSGGIILFFFVVARIGSHYEYQHAKKHFPGMTESEYIWLRPKIIAVQEKD